MNQNKNNLESIVLGGGCFWCIEAVFDRVRGVESVVSGYAGGLPAGGENPSYEKVSTGKTGYAEVAKISFDAEKISLEDILRIFFTVHDPTMPNRQGNDVGTQYRSIILYSDENQKNITEKIMQEIEMENIYDGKIVTEVLPLQKFYPAEDYHQQYFAKNPQAAYCQIVIAPKVSKFRAKFGSFYR